MLFWNSFALVQVAPCGVWADWVSRTAPGAPRAAVSSGSQHPCPVINGCLLLDPWVVMDTYLTLAWKGATCNI